MSARYNHHNKLEEVPHGHCAGSAGYKMAECIRRSPEIRNTVFQLLWAPEWGLSDRLMAKKYEIIKRSVRPQRNDVKSHYDLVSRF